MPLTPTALAKIGLVLVSLLCFSLYLWFAVTLLYLSPLPCLLFPVLGGVLYLRYGRPENPQPLYLFIAVLGIAGLTVLIPELSALPALFLLGSLRSVPALQSSAQTNR